MNGWVIKCINGWLRITLKSTFITFSNSLHSSISKCLSFSCHLKLNLYKPELHPMHGYGNATGSFDREQRVCQVCAIFFRRNTLIEAGHQPSSHPLSLLLFLTMVQYCYSSQCPPSLVLWLTHSVDSIFLLAHSVFFLVICYVPKPVLGNKNRIDKTGKVLENLKEFTANSRVEGNVLNNKQITT